MLTKWLSAEADDPLIITADSQEEALAFLACALEDAGSVQTPFHEKALVLKSAAALQKATGASRDFLAIIVSADAETLLAGVQKSQHTIILRHRGSVEDPDISLELADDKTFESGLTAMGFDHTDIASLARECGQSLTI